MSGSCFEKMNVAWVSGFLKGLGARRWMGEGKKRKEGLTQKHSANRLTHLKSGCGSDWITHNTLSRHWPQVNTSKAIGKEKPLKFFINVFILCYVVLLWTETQRRIQKGPRGRSQVLSWHKKKPEQEEFCFESLVVKRKDVLGVWKSLIYQPLPKLCPSMYLATSR